MAKTLQQLLYEYDNQCKNPKLSELPYIWNKLERVSFDDSPTDYVALCRVLTTLNQLIIDHNELADKIVELTCYILNEALRNGKIFVATEYIEETKTLKFIFKGVVCNE